MNRIHGFRFAMAENDRISELPESLITQILSYLPTKDSVKTSVLSSRWKNLWLKVPGLDLDFYHFPYRANHVFFSFVDRFLEFNPELRLRKLKVKCKSVQVNGLKDRIGTAISRGVQHLVFEGIIYYLDGNGHPCPRMDFLPLNLYTCKTLVSLKIEYSGLQDPGLVSMPCLKFMHLEKIMWFGTMNMEKLISGCPVLEELTLLRELIDNLEATVKSQSLKRFCVPFKAIRCYGPKKLFKRLEIDAPALEYMSIKDDIYGRWVVKNLTSLYMVDLDIKFLVSYIKFIDPEDVSKRNEIRDFLTGISSVSHMTISQKTVKALELYSKGGLIPKFNNLSRLQAAFSSDLLQFLPYFLESCPNLIHLILKVVYSKELLKVFELIDVSRCFLSTLECVEIKGFVKWEEEEMKIASYFLENSTVLKKLIVSLANYPCPRRVPDSEIYKELNKLPKCSPRCQIIIAS